MSWSTHWAAMDTLLFLCGWLDRRSHSCFWTWVPLFLLGHLAAFSHCSVNSSTVCLWLRRCGWKWDRVCVCVSACVRVPAVSGFAAVNPNSHSVRASHLQFKVSGFMHCSSRHRSRPYYYIDTKLFKAKSLKFITCSDEPQYTLNVASQIRT